MYIHDGAYAALRNAVVALKNHEVPLVTLSMRGLMIRLEAKYLGCDCTVKKGMCTFENIHICFV